MIITPWPGFEPESQARQACMIASTLPRHFILIKNIYFVLQSNYVILCMLYYIKVSVKDTYNLLTIIFINKRLSRLPDLNQQHSDLQSDALPNWAKTGITVGPPGFEPESQAPKAQRIDQATLWSHVLKIIEPQGGIEPPTAWLQVKRSTRLSYWGIYVLKPICP